MSINEELRADGRAASTEVHPDGRLHDASLDLPSIVGQSRTTW